ncbi:MAG: 4-phosphoerythronate dehydrogenase, partial [Bacteroidaceae bacterium]|nr:4-phosphoerythronate dehydrogenase [Bacteroidaceae bacterium]
QLARKPYLINSSRGEVVDNRALLAALENQQIRQAIIDTWEGEPHLLLPLLEKVYIGTPHIAGYSADGKANATNMVVKAFCQHFNLQQVEPVSPPALPADFSPSPDEEELALQLYNPHQDSQALKAHPNCFEELRGNYPLRREFVHKI